ncbi:MAG TPA: acyl-CoA dehydrogenase family protein [Mycobacteriales bacterium]|nr:acyl-CoA dehydrogenase family protein [Mycobacteriales bacterium]
MDVRLSPEQRALRDSAAQLVDRLTAGSVADLDDAERRAKLAAAVAGSAWRELRSADDDGHPWATAVEAAIVAEELGRGPADTAFVGPSLAAELRRLAGAPPASGAETIAMTHDLGDLARSGRPDPGAAGVAVDAAGADAALMLSAQGQLCQVALPAADGGGPDLTRRFEALPPDATLVAIDGAATPLPEDALVRLTAFGLALACADLVGVMRGTITLASNYAGVRRQYGTLIGSFQAVQHLLADSYVAMEGSRSVALHAAWAVDALPPDEALAAAATAKAYCARAARSVCEASIQVHGGIGNTWECLAHVYLRRALADADLFGGVGRCLERLLDHYELRTADGLR